MSVRQSRLFVIALVASVALLAGGGFGAMYAHLHDKPICQCEGG